MISYPSGQDGAILPARDYPPYNKSFIDQACEFIDLDSVSVRKHAKKELGQYPAILTSHLVNNPYISLFVSELFKFLKYANYLSDGKRKAGKKTQGLLWMVISSPKHKIPTRVRLQNSRFRTFSEGAKRRKRDPGVCSARA